MEGARTVEWRHVFPPFRDHRDEPNLVLSAALIGADCLWSLWKTKIFSAAREKK